MTAAAESMVAFDGRFARELSELAVPWQAEEAPSPGLLVLNEKLARDLGLDAEYLRSPEGVRLLVGNHVPPGATPVAQAYAGHQFGGYSPLLGDGRALLLGEVTDRSGRLLDIHLKGSGRTPFARAGDGRAVVGPMLREYLVSEAMYALHIPTTRALAVVGTGRQVRRDGMLPGAVLARVASSHLRVGSFQYARATENLDLLKRLADHAISRHYPQAAEAENPYLALFGSVVSAQAELVARWMLVGFVHGVMNTDNMTISGETIDYGPCAFMDAFNPAAVYSSIDVSGRYAYANQPVLAEWNLARLAEAMLPLIHEDQEQAVAPAVEVLGGFRGHYSRAWTGGMNAKLGLGSRGGSDEETTSALVDGALAILKDGPVDYTLFFRNLGKAARGDLRPVRGMVLDLAAFDSWAERWQALEPDAELMDNVNPAYIPRNHLVEEALAAATAGDLSPLQQLLEAVSDPFTERPGLERYAEGAPEDFGNYMTFCGT
ncbi:MULTISPECIES: protein adenylyltransferase SelO [unclassified Arthrobacter]|uniref:protein adenylyltransferase SelO n=1 Tax=unclassified Arthrobacter TaxID=235627 RepID=UPI001F418E36|nr:YdiU family protein [Arthrobacter sp. FW306-06-A]UKA69399.1 YdiU family protein [Arthrobacter sp. FW306-06-A]